ncbi:unnamed protein product, partial [Polarella glacialis]
MAGVNLFSVIGVFVKALSDWSNDFAVAEMHMVLNSWSFPGGFCLYGLVASLFLNYMEDGQDYSLGMISHLLGSLQEYDFLSSSGWPLSYWSLLCLLPETQGNESWQTCGPPHPLPIRHEEFFWAATEEATSSRSVVAARLLSAQLDVAVVGHHSTLSLELQTSLLHSLPDARLECKLYGQFYPEQMVVAAEPVLSAAFRGWFAAWGEGKVAFAASADHQAGAVLEAMAFVAASQPHFAAAHLFLCHYPAVLCMLLRDAMPLAPILHLYDSQAFRATPQPWLRWAALGRFRALARHSKQDVIFTTSPVVSAQVEYFSGVRLPAVTPLALYFDCVHKPAMLEAEGLLLMLFRTHAYWQTSPGVMFASVFLRFLRENAGLGPPVVPVQMPAGKHVSCEEMVQHHAVLFMPEDLVKMSFWELYRSATPLFVPSLGLASNILPHLDGHGRGAYELSMLSGGDGMLAHFFDPDAALPHFQELKEEAAATRKLFSAPFDVRARADGHRKVYQWAGLGDFWNFPAVVHFDSIPDLLRGLWTSDFTSLSTAMRMQFSDHFRDQLQKQGYCYLDNFLSDEQALELQKEVAACHAAGRLEAGGLVNGKLPSADDAKYADRATRGDVIGWFDGDEEEWPHGRTLDGYLLKLGTLVSELAKPVPELKKVTSRSKAMAACYPGGGARYVRHVDNDGKHALCRTRLLTALIYLNEGWKEGDGGELAIYDAVDTKLEREVVAPLSNRLLLFWSDTRTPHEVRPAHKLRYSVTVWLLDNTQK